MQNGSYQSNLVVLSRNTLPHMTLTQQSGFDNDEIETIIVLFRSMGGGNYTRRACKVELSKMSQVERGRVGS